jgi:hypothetical protein
MVFHVYFVSPRILFHANEGAQFSTHTEGHMSCAAEREGKQNQWDT